MSVEFSVIPVNKDKSLGKMITVEDLEKRIAEAAGMKKGKRRKEFIMQIMKDNAILQAAFKRHGGMVHCL
ncbi:MAG: hypothetical protein LBH81_00695 [Rickettsiales bacterium]|jgi:hypothetical protein|nr:hypothetical protein [Rickettsiales bacterium]